MAAIPEVSLDTAVAELILDLEPLPENPGNTRETRGFSVGIQAQIIPTLTSTADHMKDRDAYPNQSISFLVQRPTHDVTHKRNRAATKHSYYR